MGQCPAQGGIFIGLASLLIGSVPYAIAQTVGEISAPAAIDPAALLRIEIVDNDLNRDPNLAESYTTNSDFYYTPLVFESNRSETGRAAPDIAETGPNTGIFEFTLRLLTDIDACKQDNLSDPYFYAIGGPNPKIGVCPGDQISLNYTDMRIVSASPTIISRTIQVASWDPTFSSDKQWYGLKDAVTVTILDLDANLNPEAEDTFEVKAFPSSSNFVQILTAYETGLDTGMFQVNFEVPAIYGGATAIDSDYITIVYVDGFPADYAYQEEEFQYRIGIVGSSPLGGSLIINSGSEYTNNRIVQLAIDCNSPSGGRDQCYEMRVSADGTFDSETFESFAESKLLTLPEGDGEKTVRVQFRSVDGIISPDEPSDTIIMDTIAPPAPTIFSDGFSNERPLVLRGDAEQGAEVEVFDNRTSIGTTVANSPWSIMAELIEGAHILTAIATDKAGNTSPQSEPAIVVMDYSPPSGTATINLDKEYAYSPAVTLQLSCSDAVGCSSMLVSQDGVFDTELVEPFAAFKQVILNSENTAAVVYVQFIDNAGNLSPVARDGITLVSPVIQITSKSGTNPATIQGTFDAPGLDNPVVIVEWGDETETAASISGGEWQATHDYDDASGARTITAKLFDSEGNEMARQVVQLEAGNSFILIAIIAGVAAVAAGAPLGLRSMRKGRNIARSSPRVVFDYGIADNASNSMAAEKDQTKFVYASLTDQHMIGEKVKEVLVGELQNESNIRKVANELKELKEKGVRGYSFDSDKITSQLMTEGIVRLFDEINPFFASQFIQGISFEAEITVKKEGEIIAADNTMLAIEHKNRIIKFKPNIDTLSLEPYIGAALSIAGGNKIPIFRLVFKIFTSIQIGGIQLEKDESNKKKIKLSDVSFAIDPYISGLYFGSGNTTNLLPVPIPLPDKSVDIESISIGIE